MRTTLLALTVAFLAATGSVRAADSPETVMITLQAKPGSEQALADVLARHYETARRMNLLVEGAAHMTLRAEAGGKPCFIEILTWRDASIPDNAPPQILAIWKAMNALVEPRGGRPGLEIVEVTVVDTKARLP